MRGAPMGAPMDKDRRGLAVALLKLNPTVSYSRISRATGYTGQMVGVIAREMGFPARETGSFKKKDESDLIFPTEEFLKNAIQSVDPSNRCTKTRGVHEWKEYPTAGGILIACQKCGSVQGMKTQETEVQELSDGA